MDQYVFCAAADGGYFLLAEFEDVVFHRPSHSPVEHYDIRDGLIYQVGGDTPAGGFDFRKFRHEIHGCHEPKEGQAGKGYFIRDVGVFFERLIQKNRLFCNCQIDRYDG